MRDWHFRTKTSLSGLAKVRVEGGVWWAASLAADSSDWTASRIGGVAWDAWGTCYAFAVVRTKDFSANSRGHANIGKEGVLRAASPTAAELTRS